MHSDKIDEVLELAREGTKEWDDAMRLGRALVDESAQEPSPAITAKKLQQAMRHFQTAIAINNLRDEGYGWLARTLRLLSQTIRAWNPEGSTHCLQYACAVVWEARSNTPAASLSVFTKQEAKTLVAWVRMSKRLDPQAGEVEMEALRAEFLTTALDPDTMASITGV
jgi:hypothetical protein